MDTTTHHRHSQNATPSGKAPTALLPEWIRLPRSGEKCPYSSLSRSTLNALILPCKANKNRPVVKSSVLNQPGATRGVRLIHRASLMEYIAANAEPAVFDDARQSQSASPARLSQPASGIPRVQTFRIAGKRGTSARDCSVGTVEVQPIFGKPGKLPPLAPGGRRFN
jgi:hypothetical protein